MRRHLNKQPDCQRPEFSKVPHTFPFCMVLHFSFQTNPCILSGPNIHIRVSPTEREHLLFTHLQFICVDCNQAISCPSAQGESNCSSTCSRDNAGHQEDVYWLKYVMETTCDILTPQCLFLSSPEVLWSSGGLWGSLHGLLGGKQSDRRRHGWTDNLKASTLSPLGKEKSLVKICWYLLFLP